MPLADIVVPTLAVVGSWVCAGALIAGCGASVRRVLLGLASLPTQRRPDRSDLWIGLAVVIAYLQVWSLFTAISWTAWLPLVAVGLAGLAPLVHGVPLARMRGTSPWVVLATCLGVLWLANRALASPLSYDFGLYHSTAIEYASRFSAIPGLGNLQDRLGAGNAHFLLAALFGHGPWEGAGFLLVNGLLVAMLFVDVALRYAGGAGARRSAFARRMSVLLVAAAVVTAGAGAARLSEPNLDVAAFVLVVVGGIYLVEAVDGELDAGAAVTSTAALATASVTRPLFWLMTLIAIGVPAVASRRFGGPSALRVWLLGSVVPAFLAIGWLARQSVLSGYPLFPSSLVRLPVDWRMPVGDLDELNRWTRSWARWPGKTPDEVLGSWAWLGPWLRHRTEDIDVVAPSLLLCAGIVALVARRSDSGERTSAWPLLAVVIPSATVLVVWFVTAPDPRFALGAIWLIPVALVAWAAPSLRWPGMALPAVAAWVLVALALAVGIEHDAEKRAFRPVTADGAGPLGTEEVPAPELERFRTESGLVLWHPAGGSDQCWRALLCVATPSRDVRMRGTTIRSGFAKSPAPASNEGRVEPGSYAARAALNGSRRGRLLGGPASTATPTPRAWNVRGGSPRP